MCDWCFAFCLLFEGKTQQKNFKNGRMNTKNHDFQTDLKSWSGFPFKKYAKIQYPHFSILYNDEFEKNRSGYFLNYMFEGFEFK